MPQLTNKSSSPVVASGIQIPLACFFMKMIDFHSFLPEDPKEAKRIFNTLPAEQQ